MSEGLYRRLLVAIRLLVLPSILCLDELTTGQDAGTALALTMGAGQLARRGLAVVVVVHQPAAELFALFDQVIAVPASWPVVSSSRQRIDGKTNNRIATSKRRYKPSDNRSTRVPSWALSPVSSATAAARWRRAAVDAFSAGMVRA